MNKMKRFVKAGLKYLNLGSIYEMMASYKASARNILYWLRLRLNYHSIERRIRNRKAGEKIVVLFWVTSSHKWKAQSLYEALARSSEFKPLIAIAFDPVKVKVCPEDADKEFLQVESFFKNLGDEVVRCCDYDTKRAIPLSEFGADIVFYQEPHSFEDEHQLQVVARYALCCYVPYAIIIASKHLPIHSYEWFHHMMYLQVALNKADVRFLNEVMPWYRRAGHIVGLGHLICDQFAEHGDSEKDEKLRGCVIYAPHFSFTMPWRPDFKRPLVVSTFLQTGEAILAYAQEHPEFKWVFKPHPKLRFALIYEAGMSEEKVNRYYNAWEQVGIGYYQGDYVELFKKSRAMITDCASFLAEYPLTGHPLIRLIPHDCSYPALPFFQKVFDHFYNVYNIDEMYAAFKCVLERNLDPKRSERLRALKEQSLTDGCAAENILRFLRKKLVK